VTYDAAVGRGGIDADGERFRFKLDRGWVTLGVRVLFAPDRVHRRAYRIRREG